LEPIDELSYGPGGAQEGAFALGEVGFDFSGEESMRSTRLATEWGEMGASGKLFSRLSAMHPEFSGTKPMFK
jgi:hypothetical protein